MIRLKLKTRTYKRKTEKTLLEAGWQGYKTYKWIKNVFFNWNVFNITEEKGPEISLFWNEILDYE